MFKKRSQPKTFIDEVGETLQSVSDAVRESSAQALEASGPYLERANEWIHEASDAAAPRIREASERLQNAAESVRPHVESVLNDAKSRFEDARDAAGKEYDSRLAPALRDQADSAEKRGRDAAEKAGATAASLAGVLAAKQTPKGLEDAVVRITGDKKAMKKARKALKQAGKDIEKRTAQKKTSGATWFWVGLGVVGAGAIAFAVARRLRPVEDPWSTPLPGNRPADARPVGSTPRSEQSPAQSVTSQVPVPAAAVDNAKAEGVEVEGSDDTEGGDKPTA
ncbi:hypothetical protein [Brevibacterium senegalense]|uniref:hypothetical protein n=1 Tax=Brevibacterium senegalense TaxID=1033736 RepID=UPI0002F47B01|nr:hypothetical protein [Brevibacterium senegalense]